MPAFRQEVRHTEAYARPSKAGGLTPNEKCLKLIKGNMIRHKVKPGITGWAQVNGLRGET